MYLPEQAEMPTGPTPTVLQAIVAKRCVTAVYNRMSVVLAPHVLFQKNEALYVGAITLERDGRPPRELKLGAFKLDGLAGLALINRGFERSTLYDPADERFATMTLMAVD